MKLRIWKRRLKPEVKPNPTDIKARVFVEGDHVPDDYPITTLSEKLT